jgi:hypothetical protein
MAFKIFCLAVAVAIFAPVRSVAGGAEPLVAQNNRADLVVLKDRLRKSVSFRKIKAKPGDCTVVEGCVGGFGKRRILEFDTYVLNRGSADLVLGKPEDHPELYEYSPCHGHYHLRASFVYGLTKGGDDTAAVYSPETKTVYARNENTTGVAEPIFQFPPSASGAPIAGDWDGDGTVTPGLYDAATGTFTLTNLDNAEPIVFRFAPAAGALAPIVGDWNGKGIDTVGLYNPATGNAYLKAKNNGKKQFETVQVGARDAATWVAIAGDWNGDDVDTIGFYDRATGSFELKNRNAPGAPDASFAFGAPGLEPIAGDWDQDGVTTVGVYDAETGRFEIRDENAAGVADAVFALETGVEGAVVPLAGDWDYNFGELVLPGKKEAFCWIDTQRVTGGNTMRFFDCNQQQGLTVGWADIYIRGTDCQWIDITDLPAGVYQLALTVNAEGLIPESNLENNSAIVKVRVPEPRKPLKLPRVTVTSPSGGEHFEIGEPVEITWKVKGASITRQELWLADMHDDHPSKVLLIDGEIPAGARSYTWTPTEEFSSASAQFIVRAQNDEEFMGTDSRSKGRVEVGDGHDHEARRCSCPAGNRAGKPLTRHGR